MKDYTVHIELDWIQINVDNSKTYNYFEHYDYVGDSLLDRFIVGDLFCNNYIGDVIDGYEIINDGNIFLHFDFSKVEEYYSSFNKEKSIIDAVDRCDLYVRLCEDDDFCKGFYSEDKDVWIECIVKVINSYPYEDEE